MLGRQTPIIFCCDPFDTSRPHYMWSEESKAASNVGQIFLLDHEALLEGNVKKALRKIPEGDGGSIIYHGWMMLPEIYQTFYHGLFDKSYRLINSAMEYVGCHHIANWYPIVQEDTPETIIVKSNSIDKILSAISVFGDSSLIIKDYVSSQKHSWKEACFIPSAQNTESATKIISKFMELQGEVDGIQGGLVIRRYVPLKYIGEHPKSGMPLSQEFRVFVLNGQVVSLCRYWEYGQYGEDMPPSELIEKIIKKITQKIGSHFFTIDLAQKQDGGWICIEVGDGQVSSLPKSGNKKTFYSKIMNIAS